MHIPFIFQKTGKKEDYEHEPEKGLRVNVVGSMHEYSEAKGAWISGLFNYLNSGDFKGVLASGLANLVEEVNGLAIAGICSLSGELNGVSVSGLCNVYGKLNGVSYGTFGNFCGEVGKYGVQIGAFNYIRFFHEEDWNDSFVLQIGLWNRAGNQTCPLINVRGWKNLFGGKKEETLEDKAEKKD